MAVVRGAVETHAERICDALEAHGCAIVENFLPTSSIAAMRAEAEELLRAGELRVSESTRWDGGEERMVRYEKHNVMATSLAGGDKYALAPRLTEYVVSLVSSLPARVSARFDGVELNEAAATNKLAVCLGEESSYDKHIDNMGGDDLRKLTVLLYLQGQWQPRMGGCFRMFSSDDVHAYDDIAPLGGRLLAFWSDTRVHAVCPSFAPAGAEEHRWALTVWLHASEPAAIRSDPRLEALHFPLQQHG